MYVPSPRRRRAVPPNPIRSRRPANSPLFAGHSPAPWTPDHPAPTPSTAAPDSADTPTFPVSPSSESPAICTSFWQSLQESSPNYKPSWATTDSEWGGSPESPYFSKLDPAEDSPGAVTPGSGSGAGTIPRTPASTPVAGRSGSGIGASRGRVSKLSRILYSPGLPISPPLRWWKGEGHRPVRETDGEDESESESGSDRIVTPGLELERLQGKRTLDVKTCVYHGGGRAKPMLWWRYPLVVLLLVLILWYVPWKRWI